MAKKTKLEIGLREGLNEAVVIDLPTTKCLVPVRGHQSYGFNIVEIPQHLIDQCKVVEVVEPDIFSICDTQATKALRNIFEI